jgi:hypothetical protein
MVGGVYLNGVCRVTAHHHRTRGAWRDGSPLPVGARAADLRCAALSRRAHRLLHSRTAPHGILRCAAHARTSTLLFLYLRLPPHHYVSYTFVKRKKSSSMALSIESDMAAGEISWG